MTARIPRQAIPWRLNAINTLWGYVSTPWLLNGRLRVSLPYRPLSTRSAPDPSPRTTGWWTIGLGLTYAKPDAIEWAGLGVYQNRFCMLSAVKSHAAAPHSFGEAGSHHGWVFGEDLLSQLLRN